MEKEESILKDLIARYPALNIARKEIWTAFNLLVESFESGGKLLIAGNGGSAADSEHISGELLKGFRLKRQIPDSLKRRLADIDESSAKNLSCALEQGLPAIPLVSFEALTTAFSNDSSPECTFAQLVMSLGRAGDVFLGITTSGNSENIILAGIVAKAIGMKIITLTGRNGGKIASYSDVCIKAPEEETFKVQELHLPVYHCICLMLEAHFFGDCAGGLE